MNDPIANDNAIGSLDAYDELLLDAGIYSANGLGDPVVEEKIRELARADEDRGLRDLAAGIPEPPHIAPEDPETDNHPLDGGW